MSDRLFCIGCECPVTGVDFDIVGPGIPGPDGDVDCSECGGTHRLGDIGEFYGLENDGTIAVVLDEDEWRKVSRSELNGYRGGWT